MPRDLLSKPKDLLAKKPIDFYKRTFDESSGFDRFMIGVGGGMTGLAQGAGQRLGLVDQEKINEYRKSMDPVNESGLGMAGNITGKIAGTIPAAFVPGANTVAGAAVIGGLMGAAEPTLENESVVDNTLMGTLGGAAGQRGGGLIASQLQKRAVNKAQQIAAQKSADAVRNATLKQSKAAGYVVPPSQAGAGVGPRLMEGISGKYKTNQLAGIRNQQATNRLAKKAVGMAPDDNFSREGLQAIRNKAFTEGYKPLHKLGQIIPDKDYTKALDDIVSSRNSAAQSFPEAVSDDVSKLIDNLRVDQFDSSHAVEMTKYLREQSKQAYRQGDNALGKATKSAANALEDQLERHLKKTKGAGDLLKKFRDSRQLMAKTHTVENALEEGSGSVDATKISREYAKGKPLTDELETIGKFGQVFKKVARIPDAGDANPLTIIDFGYGAAGGMIDPTLMALPAARVGARYGMLSQPFQKAFVNPKYARGLLPKLEAQAANSEMARMLMPRAGAMGLLGYSE